MSGRTDVIYNHNQNCKWKLDTASPGRCISNDSPSGTTGVTGENGFYLPLNQRCIHPTCHVKTFRGSYWSSSQIVPASLSQDFRTPTLLQPFSWLHFYSEWHLLNTSSQEKRYVLVMSLSMHPSLDGTGCYSVLFCFETENEDSEFWIRSGRVTWLHKLNDFSLCQSNGCHLLTSISELCPRVPVV